jgi:hypothetical protein
MIKPLLLVPFAFIGLASAAPPPPMAGGPMGADDYPPCSASVTDRCIQTYERGRRHHMREMREAYGAPPPPSAEAGPAPVQMSGGDYPPCTATRTDRCQQGGSRAAPTRLARWERQRVMIGERG